MTNVVFGWYDALIFLAFFSVIVIFSMYKSRKEKPEKIIFWQEED